MGEVQNNILYYPLVAQLLLHVHKRRIREKKLFLFYTIYKSLFLNSYCNQEKKAL